METIILKFYKPQLNEDNIFNNINNAYEKDIYEKNKAEFINKKINSEHIQILNTIYDNFQKKIEQANIIGCDIIFSDEIYNCNGIYKRYINLIKRGTGSNSHINLIDTIPIIISSVELKCRDNDTYETYSEEYDLTIQSKKTITSINVGQEVSTLEMILRDSIEHFIINVY
jgi:hypothetical protein